MKTFTATILAALILPFAASTTDAEKIRTAIPQANLNYLSIHVADAKGFFKEEGLDNGRK
jgi:ABC-type nitrate/sulfonate/bicarbonate transport system substrate-binding protein